MESILRGVANSSIPQDMYVFVSVCVWEVGEVTTRSSPQPRSTSYSSRCGRTFHAEPLTLRKCRGSCEVTSNPEKDARGLSPGVRVGQGTPESIIHSGNLATEREDSVSDNRGAGRAERVVPLYKQERWGPVTFRCRRGVGARLTPRPPDSHHTLQPAQAAVEAESSTPHSHVPKPPPPKWCSRWGFNTSLFSFWGQVTVCALGSSSGSGKRRHPGNGGVRARMADVIKRRALGRSPWGPLPVLPQPNTQDSLPSLPRRG